MNNLLTAQNLSVFRGNSLIFKNVDISINEGEAIHLLGDNGAGKTTLVQTEAGILIPDSGKIIKNCELLYLGHSLGIKLNLTVWENLKFAAILYHNLNNINKELDLAINSLGLEKYKNILVNELSAGQKRKVQLARLFFKDNKKLWLLDEPFNTLDIKTVELLKNHLETHIKNKGAIILTTHQNFNMNNLKTLNLRELSTKGNHNDKF